MIDDKVTSLKNIRQKNLPYMITWILYYAWIGAFMTWWTASPMTDRIYGTDSRVLLHSLLLFSSAVVVLFFKPPTFVKYSRIGAIVIVVNSLLFYITYMVNAAPIVHSVATVILALSLGIVNISVFIPLCYVLNNTEKFYAIIGTNFLIVILAILQETNVINERIVFSISFAVLIGSIVPIYWFRETHYEEERIRCEKHIPKKPKSIYFTIALNMLYALYMSTENSVNRSLKTRSLLTKFGTRSIVATGAVTISYWFRSRFRCFEEFLEAYRNRLPYQSGKLCM